MKNKKVTLIIILLCVLGLILSFPSIYYLFKVGTVDGYFGQNYYFLNPNENMLGRAIFNEPIRTILGTAIFAGILIWGFVLYFKLIKNSDNFKNIKFILLGVFLVSICFMICLPNTSTDIFYYMGNGRILEKYNENPYYVTIEDVIHKGNNDIILENSGVWSNTVVPYGPLWLIISACFSKISFGNITVLLYIFKTTSLFIHVACAFLVYQITKKKKFAIIYGFNPFLLLEFMTNVHNDIYLIFFVLLGIHFLKNKRDILNALICLACSVLIKYVTLILAPFFLLYHLRNKKISTKIKDCIIYAIFFCSIIILVYMLFFSNLNDFLEIMSTQQGRLKDSIYLILNSYELENLISPVNTIFILLTAGLMIYFIFKMFFKENRFRKYMGYVSIVLLVLIFGVLTNLTSWYLAWLFIPIFWLKSENIKRILYLQFFYEFTYVYLCYVHSDAIKYNVKIIPMIILRNGN